MRRYLEFVSAIALLCISFCLTFAQENVTVVAAASEAAEGLDLHAVAELFKDSENLEAFEKALNDPEEGVNNLDLDENDEIDYIRIVEEVADGTHVIILQAVLAEDEFQDVATIEVEKNSEADVNLQIHGNDDIYGADYYMAPTVVSVHTWPMIVWLYRPHYRPYRSVFHFGVYPRWWKPYRPVKVNVYRTRTVKLRGRKTFVVHKKSRVKTVRRVNYKPRNSKRVTKTTIKTRRGRTTVKRTQVKRRRN